MKDTNLIKEISENLKDLSIPFRYLEELKNCNESIQEENQPADNSKDINLKPMRIDKYQTSSYMQAGTYFKPISRFFLSKKSNSESDEIIETIL